MALFEVTRPEEEGVSSGGTDGIREYLHNSIFGHLWDDITGKSNTAAQNSAAAALQEDAQAFNSAEAEKTRNWEEYMSNTAYQRSVADLKAAGLNPWLAVNNAASSGSSVYASSGISNAQASNVNLMQTLGTTAVGLAALVKVLKAIV